MHLLTKITSIHLVIGPQSLLPPVFLPLVSIINQSKNIKRRFQQSVPLVFEMYCCVCGLDIDGIEYPDISEYTEDEIAWLYDRVYDKEQLPESQLEVYRTERGFDLG